MDGVVLAGPFGAGSPADEAALGAALAALDGVDIVVLSGDPEETGSRHGCRAVPLADPDETARAMTGAAVVTVGDLPRFAAMEGADAVVGRLLGPVRRRPVVAVGVGIGPTRSERARRRARTLAARSSALVVRDAASAGNLAAAGAVPPFWVGAELAWASLPGPSPAIRSDDALICVDDWRTVADLGPVSAACAENGLGLLVQSWPGAEAGPVPPVPWTPVPSPESLVAARTTFAGVRLVVAKSRGPVLAAVAAGTPVVVVDPDSGAAELAARLGQVVVRADDPPSLLAGAVFRALGDGAPLPEAVGVEAEAALQSLGIMRALVDGGGRIVETSKLRLVAP